MHLHGSRGKVCIHIRKRGQQTISRSVNVHCMTSEFESAIVSIWRMWGILHRFDRQCFPWSLCSFNRDRIDRIYCKRVNRGNILAPSIRVKSLTTSRVVVSIILPQKGKYLDPCSRGTLCASIVRLKLTRLFVILTEQPYSGYPTISLTLHWNTVMHVLKECFRVILIHWDEQEIVN
jgi:hypothetical protein